MKVLALDQSSKITGWAYFEDGLLTEYGKFEAEDKPMQYKLHSIQKKVAELGDKFNIDVIVIEDIQLQSNNNNVVTFKTLAFVMAAIMMLCAEWGIPCEIIPSSTWKSKCGVKGRVRADQKRDAQRFVQENFEVKAIQDTVDAICIGYAYHKIKNAEVNWA
jgi:Holliday junction resolvasome RuvABC endonuclease subunit